MSNAVAAPKRTAPEPFQDRRVRDRRSVEPAVELPVEPLPLSVWSILLDAVPFALIVLDPNDRIVGANHAGEQLLGAGRTLLQGRPLCDYIAADSPVFSLIAEARNGSIAVAEPD